MGMSDSWRRFDRHVKHTDPLIVLLTIATGKAGNVFQHLQPMYDIACHIYHRPHTNTLRFVICPAMSGSTLPFLLLRTAWSTHKPEF